ncbi:DUF2852 domain-containing protein [uncultured Cohaesibacter sp.]|uniref:DUF2852 domain-containing protein n=1 Tax=uncultured Cohaesibacter sp. TaxID=1002546 RepID=UPI00292EEA23|nr:DUF2852 domain-containing protein [uncultured Cohaesibacter sp.]
MSHCKSFKSSWKGSHIALMIIGFIIFWPLGLAMLAYMIWGDEMREMFQDFKTRLNREFKGSGRHHCHHRGFDRTGNVAFDDYRKSELERLEEERRKLEAEKAEFEDFLAELHRAKDKEEFDRFMAARQNARPTMTTGETY